MAEPWAQSYKLLGTGARAVLDGLALLRPPTVSLSSVAPLGGIGHEAARAALTELSEQGWVVRCGLGGWTVPEEPAAWLTTLGGDVDPATARATLTRLAEHLTAGVSTWADATRGAEIVATIRGFSELRCAEAAVALARSVWQTLRPPADPVWWPALAEAGEEAATAGRLPHGLIDVLRESGHAFSRVGETHVADRQWRRAYLVSNELGDREHSGELLTLVGRQRRANRSFGRALTVLHQLVDLRKETDDALGLAEALVELAVTMLDAERADEATHFLERSSTALPAVETLTGPDVSRHAGVLVSLGRAWGRQDMPATAMQFFSAALKELVDLDDTAADEARTLLAEAARARDKR